MKSALDNLINSGIVQGVLAIIAIGGTVVIAIRQQVVPDYLQVLDGAIIGYYFGTAHITLLMSAVEKLSNGKHE